MRNMFKKIAAIFMCAAMVSALFAEPASTGISDSDVKNWAKNLNPIVKELQTLGVWDGDSINATAGQKSKVDAVLNKYGISGANCMDKFGMITSCAIVVIAADGLDAQSAALLKSMGMDPLAELKKNVNSKDLTIVEANSKAVVNAYNNLDTDGIDYTSATGAAADFSYGDQDLADLYSRLGAAFAQQAVESEDKDPEHAAAIKKLYEQISKAKGDTGYIYKKKETVSSCKKTSYKKGTVLTKENGYGPDELNWSFDLDKKKAKLDFTWDKNTKTINYTISSVEYFYSKGDYKGGEAKEYVVATKEGPVFHFYRELSSDGNAITFEIGIKGVDLKSITDWNYEYNSWSDYDGD